MLHPSYHAYCNGTALRYAGPRSSLDAAVGGLWWATLRQKELLATSTLAAAAAAASSARPVPSSAPRKPASRDGGTFSVKHRIGSGSSTKSKEAHLIFDEVFINVKSGDGGTGEVVAATKGKTVDNFKYKPGGNSPKRFFLPHSNPADGADGAPVVLVCDSSCLDLLHLHSRQQYSAPRGGNGNPAVGSGGPKNNKAIKKAHTAPLEIPVPPGTVVKRKSTGTLLGELTVPGQRLVVAQGGRGGAGVVTPSPEAQQRMAQRAERAAQAAGAEIVSVADHNWRRDAQGEPGQQMGLHLLLRVVADVGIVGLPNAGKSSLLAALTRASPEIAPYPFTTLMPNLGVMAAGSGSDGFAPGTAWAPSKGPVLADLPGLIQGAHTGRGLGRMFLRHLRRTQALLHVIDASAPDPAADYVVVREELRMYNPAYCSRPHVVALNKMDLEDADALRRELTSDIRAAADRLRAEWHERREQEALDKRDQQARPAHPDGRSSSARPGSSSRAGSKAGRGDGGAEMEDPEPVLPAALVSCSAVSGEGLQQLAQALEHVLRPGGSGPPAASRRGDGSAAAAAAATPRNEDAHAWLLELTDTQLMDLEKSHLGGRRAGWRTSPLAAAAAAGLTSGLGAIDAALAAERRRRLGAVAGLAVKESMARLNAGGDDEAGVAMVAEPQEDLAAAAAAEAEHELAGTEAAWLLDLNDEELSSLEAAVRQEDEVNKSLSESGESAEEEEEDVDEGLLEQAPDDDDDIWMLDLSEDELLAMEDGEAPSGLLLADGLPVLADEEAPSDLTLDAGAWATQASGRQGLAYRASSSSDDSHESSSEVSEGPCGGDEQCWQQPDMWQEEVGEGRAIAAAEACTQTSSSGNGSDAESSTDEDGPCGGDEQCWQQPDMWREEAEGGEGLREEEASLRDDVQQPAGVASEAAENEGGQGWDGAAARWEDLSQQDIHLLGLSEEELLALVSD